MRISFGQPAYLAVGAYAAGFYLYYFGSNPYLAVLLGMLGGLVAALIVGPLFVKLRSDYFALVNLALAVIIFYLTQTVFASVTFGDNGLWFLANIATTLLLAIGACCWGEPASPAGRAAGRGQCGRLNPQLIGGP